MTTERVDYASEGLGRIPVFGDLIANWPLVKNLVLREARQRYKGSAFGVLWTLATPIVMVAAYWFVFSKIWKVTIPHHWLFIFLGLTIWTFFFGGAQVAAQSLVANAALVTKVRFPRQIVPIAAIWGNAVTAIVMLLIAIPLCLLLTPGDLRTAVLLPIIMVFLAVLTMGFGLLLSVLNVYFRDVEHILAAVGLPWLFLSPVFWTPAAIDQIAPGLRENNTLIDLLVYLNPLAPFLVATQEVLFFGVWPSAFEMGYIVVVSILMLAVGWAVFQRLEGEIAVEL